jgi:hypothetical protein
LRKDTKKAAGLLARRPIRLQSFRLRRLADEEDDDPT